jgi:hypothetical protein
MTDHISLTPELAAQRIAGQIADRQGSTPRSHGGRARRAPTRHSVARHLHRLADRLDG